MPIPNLRKYGKHDYIIIIYEALVKPSHQRPMKFQLMEF